MKLRIEGDTLRLRLSRPDVDRLSRAGAVRETVHLAPGASWAYAVVAGAEVAARWDGACLVVTVPRDGLVGWATDDREGFGGEQDAGEGRVLTIRVEKDYACGHREGDAQAAFTRPGTP